METKKVITASDLFAIVNEAFVEACMTYCIRNGKRYNRYELNLSKDLRRIKFLLKRSWNRFPLMLQELQEACIGVGGLEHKINIADLKIPAVSDFAEVVALVEYWSLWDFSNELLALTGKH